jgi:hypothetical protein
MLDSVTEIFSESQMNISSTSSGSKNINKLLIILSDGRGVFYEGIDRVKNSIQRAIKDGIFIVFVVLDINAENDSISQKKSTSSIFDIRMPIFKDGSPVSIHLYSQKESFFLFKNFFLFRFQKLSLIWNTFHFHSILYYVISIICQLFSLKHSNNGSTW